jgi:competence protein ComEC
MLWAATAYSAGIITGLYVWHPPVLWIASGCFFIFAAAYFALHRSRFAWTIALAALFLAGALHIQVRGADTRLDTSILPYADGRELQITGHVVRDGRVQPGALGEIRQTVELQAEEIQTDTGQLTPVNSGIRVAIYAPSGTTMSAFSYGDRLRFSAKLRRPRNFRNPGSFDYEGYLADRGIAALGSAKLEKVERLPGFSGTRLSLWRSRLHRSIVAKVHELWPPREAALIDAMVIGEEAFIDRDTRVDFQRSGTYHVLVVSGMNVSILAFVVFWTLRRLRISDVPATLVTVATCAAYAFITEVGAPVWRATLMCAVYLATRLLYRDRAMVNALGAAALGLLVVDPRQLLTPSFQMTFVCVLIVAGIGIPILERSSQLYKRALANWDSQDYAALLPPRVAQFRVELQFIASRLELFIGEGWARRLTQGSTRFFLGAWELLFISAVMQMGMALPMAYYFHRATTIGLPANIIVVPLTQLMMPAAISTLALGYISRWIARVPAMVTSFAIDGIAGTVRGLSAFRVADLRVAMPSDFMIVVAVTALLLALWAARRRRLFVFAGLSAILVTSLALAFVAPRANIRPGVLEVTSIDVGEGDCTLLVTPQGRTLLVDAGGPIGPGGSQLDFGEDVVSPYLWTRGITRLDAVAVSHGHSDHIGGMAAILKNFKPKELWIGLMPPSEGLDQVVATAQSLGIKVIRHWEGDEVDFGGTRVDVLYPSHDSFAADKPRNNDSMILRVAYGATSVLLEGDAEKQIERRTVARHHPTANLLKVGHHGSANATTPEFVDSVKPQFAVISVGWGNSFGLPRMQTLERLTEAGARVYRTDLAGATTFYLDGHSVTTSSEAHR